MSKEEAAVWRGISGMVPQGVHEVGHVVVVDHRDNSALGYGGPQGEQPSVQKEIREVSVQEGPVGTRPLEQSRESVALVR